MLNMLKLKYLITLTLLLLLTSLWAQTDTIHVVPEYQKGQRFILKITESSRVYEDKKMTSESSNEYDIKVNILDKHANGYLMKFDLRDFLFFNNEPDWFDQINHLDKGLVIELNLDREGTLESIANWEDLRDQAHKMLDDIRISLGYNEQLVANFDTLKETLSTESKLQDHFVEEAQLWLLANGLNFQKGEVYKIDAMMPILFSNDSIPTLVSLGMKKIENDLASIFYLQTFERTDVQDFLIDEVAFFSGFDLELLKSLDSFDFFMEHESNLKVNIHTGICEKFNHRKVIKMNDYKVIHRLQGELKEIR